LLGGFAADCGKNPFAAVVDSDRFVDPPGLLIAAHQLAVEGFGAVIDLQAAAVAFDGLIGLAVGVEHLADAGDVGDKPFAQTLAARVRPGLVPVSGEEVPLVKTEGLFDEGRSLAGVTSLPEGSGATQQGLEGPGVDPDVLPVEREVAFVEDHRLLVVEQFAQSVQGGLEGFAGGQRVAVWPEVVMEFDLVDLAAAVGDQRLEQLQWFFLDLAGELHPVAIAQDGELAEGDDL